VLQVPQGYPAWAGESGGGVEEAHCAGAADQPSGEDHPGRCGEPQEQRVHLVIVGYCNLSVILLLWFATSDKDAIIR
jgi:hypothetical protein